MKHDKLLARIAKLSITPETNVVPSELATALMAVVELHAPFDGYCQRCTVNNWGELRQEYPCDEIQAIEKELL